MVNPLHPEKPGHPFGLQQGLEHQGGLAPPGQVQGRGDPHDHLLLIVAGQRVMGRQGHAETPFLVGLALHLEFHRGPRGQLDLLVGSAPALQGKDAAGRLGAVIPEPDLQAHRKPLEHIGGLGLHTFDCYIGPLPVAHKDHDPGEVFGREVQEAGGLAVGDQDQGGGLLQKGPVPGGQMGLLVSGQYSVGKVHPLGLGKPLPKDRHHAGHLLSQALGGPRKIYGHGFHRRQGAPVGAGQGEDNAGHREHAQKQDQPFHRTAAVPPFVLGFGQEPYPGKGLLVATPLAQKVQEDGHHHQGQEPQELGMGKGHGSRSRFFR